MDREHTPTEENLAKEIMKKLDVCKMRLAFMSECLAELCESETISRNGGRVIDRRRTVGQDANLERVLQEVRCSSTRDYRENPSGDSPIKTNRSSQLGVVDCTSQGCPSLCNSRHYIKRRNLREPTPTEWRSLYKDRLKRLFNDAENYSWDEELDGGSAVLYREVEFYPGGMRILDSSHGTSSRVAYESLPPTEWQSTESCHLYRAGHPLVLVIVFGRPIRRGRRRSFDVYFKCLEADHVAQKCPEKDGCGEPHHTQAKESIEFASARTNSDPATKLTNVSSPDTMETMNVEVSRYPSCHSQLLNKLFRQQQPTFMFLISSFDHRVLFQLVLKPTELKHRLQMSHYTLPLSAADLFEIFTASTCIHSAICHSSHLFHLLISKPGAMETLFE
ncbi:hypothetical protein T4B_12320 [Trichinella pseudospiralis]|uniref:Uncharacterized protein n=1 Tax=Trichinella pseudospiralis TaxID=6337 RepID=A0A0V1JHZ9_TRIPS|nr:hypothetical protein T4B_12320 [Trichinella pseudospiralis]